MCHWLRRSCCVKSGNENFSLGLRGRYINYWYDIDVTLAANNGPAIDDIVNVDEWGIEREEE